MKDNKTKVSCEDCKFLQINGYGRTQYTCKHKHKIRGIMNLFNDGCVDKQVKEKSCQN